MNINSSIRWVAGVLAVWLLTGCAQEERTLPSSEKAPFDVQQVMDQVHFAFRPQGLAWEGGHSTYAVRVEADSFSVTPYHYPRGQPPGAEAPRPSPEQGMLREESASQEFVEGAPVRFGAAQVSREGMVLSSHKAQGRVKDSGGLTLARGEVAEHFRNSRDGVEQSWSFEQRLKGTGALEVRVPVESGHFLGETEQGLHFAAGTTGLSVRYGHGTWVDAEGHRTPVPARFEAGTIVLSVPAQVVDASVYPAVLDPIVSPEYGMDDPVNGPADGSQYYPAVANNGTDFLVVWQDSRSGSSYDIYGARVSGTGTVLDLTGIRITTAINSQEAPAVAYDGTNFLVVWQDSRSGSGYDIYGTRVSGTGTVLDTGGIPISTATSSQYYPAVAHDGTNFLVVWQDYRSSNADIYGARVSGTGTVLDISGIPISTAVNNQNSPAVAHNGTNFLVVWQDYRSGTGFSDIYGARVNGTGTVLNTSGIQISNAVNSQEAPAVAYNGVDFLVVWQDFRSGTGYDIYGSRVSGTGVVRNPNGIPISTASNDQSSPTVAREGTNFLVVWQDYRSYDIYGARVNSTGTVLDTGGILISTASSSAYSPAVAHDGTNFLVMWHDYSGASSPNIYGARVSGTGTVLGPSDIFISRSANGQYAPVVTHDGTNFLVVWLDYRNGGSEVYGARVSEDGMTVLDASGIRISTATSSQYSPAVTHDGTNFLVVWQDYRGGSGYDIYGARVSSAGTVLDFGGIPISIATNSQYTPAVAYNGVSFLVVWQDYRNGNSDIYGARVSSAGAVLDTGGIAISTTTGTQDVPTVAHHGENFLVVWQDYRSGNSDIYGARVDGTGMVLDISGIPISTATNYQYTPVVANNGIHSLVVWQDYRNGSADIYGARVDNGGSVLDTTGVSISTATSTQTAPSVAYDGANFVIVWQDYRSGTGFSDIYGARVSETGTVLEVSGFVISAEPVTEGQPRITSMGGESALVVYRSSSALPDTNSERVRSRLVMSP